jgi:hypothetical protein
MAKATGDHTPARAAVKIEFEPFAYTDQQWDRIKAAVRDALGIDADQTEREITPVIRKTLRSSIEFTVSQYYFQSATSSRRRRRAELSALRNDARNLQDSIFDALAAAVDSDLLCATRDYFTKLLRNLDHQIEQAEQRGDNARKTARDQCWSELLAIWCDIGGKPRGVAAAEFLWVASRPVMGKAIPAHKSVVQWLKRRLSSP